MDQNLEFYKRKHGYNEYVAFVNRQLPKLKGFESAQLNIFLDTLRSAVHLLYDLGLISKFNLESLEVPESVEPTESHYIVGFITLTDVRFYKRFDLYTILTQLLYSLNLTIY